MADLTVTSTQVLPSTDTVTAFGIAGVAINAGQMCWLDTTAGTYKLFDADLTASNANTPALALTTAAIGQPITVATSGTITIGAGAAPTQGIVYVCSATAGGIAPSADIATNWKVAFVGVGNSTNRIKLLLGNSGIVK